MKALLLILILYLSHISCDDIDTSIKNPRLYLKKKQSQIKILNAGKKIINNKLPSFKEKTKKIIPKSTPYTVFPNVNGVQNQSVGLPDSPYFPLEKNYDQKPRVKKNLPNTKSSLRRKRSVNQNNATNVAKTATKTHVAKAATKTHVAKAATKTHVAKAATKTKTVLAKNNNIDKRKNKKGKQTHNKVASKKRSKTQKIKRTGKKLRSQRSRKKRNGTRLSKNKKTKGQRIELTYNESPGSKSKKQRNVKNNRKGQVARSKKSKKLKRPTNHSLKSKSGKVDARRLIAGRDATIQEFPYVVSIQKRHQHWCTGALLNPQLVITTANCIWKSSSISRLRVRAGSRYADRGGQVVGIQEVMKHPGWGIRKDPDYDVGLLLLKKRIRFSDSVHAADLPNRIMMPPFEDAWVASWGADRRDGVYDIKDVNLQSFHARLIKRAKCNNMTQRFGVTVTENFICLAQTGTHGPCTRDTGAPAVSDGVVWGLASWGLRKLCGTERYPAMFSYLGSNSNMDFIVNATHYLMSDQRSYPFPGRFPILPKTTTDIGLVTL